MSYPFLDRIEAILDGMPSDATAHDLYDALSDFNLDDVDAVLAARSVAGGGPGGSQDLAAVLTVGGDPDGNPITGAVVIDTAGVANAVPLTASTDFNGDGLGLYVADVSGQTTVKMYGNLVEIGDENFAPAIKMDTTAGGGRKLGFFGHSVSSQPVVPLTLPTVQDVIDALVALGLVSQSD